VAQSTVRLIVDAQNAITPLKRVNEQTKNLSNSTNKLKNRLNEGKKSFDRFGNSGKRASSGVNNLVNSLKKLAAAFAVIQTAKFVIFQTAELERQRKSLEVLTGSVAKTNKIIAELKAFGAVTPFKASQLIETTKRLKAFGFETDKLVDNTKRIADIAGATGAELDGIATAFGQIQAKGKLQQEENLQLLERGVDITTELKNITGLQGDAFADAMRKGKIGADLVNQALINLTNEGGAFFGGASAQSTTLAGKFSTLVDGVETLAQQVGEKLEPALKGALDVAIDLVTNINQAIAAGSITDVDKKALRQQALEIVEEQTTALQRSFFGVGEVKVNFEGQEFKGQPAAVQSQITNALINAEVAKRLKEQLEVQKKLAETNKENIDNTKEIKNNFEQTNFLVDGLSLSTENFADKLSNVKSEADLLKEKFMEIGQGIEQGIVSNLTDAVMGTKTLAQAATSVLNDLKRKLVEVAIQRAVSGIGNFFGNALSGLFGGGGGHSFLGAPMLAPVSGLKFADGGRPPVGRASLVGERGPELFVPDRAGTIIPNNAMGSTNIVVNVDASGSSVEGDRDGQQFGEALATAIQSEIVKQKRSGGLLA